MNAAGNETTTNLISWTGKVLGENPDQLAELAADPSLVPERHRGTAALRSSVTHPVALLPGRHRVARPGGTRGIDHKPADGFGQP